MKPKMTIIGFGRMGRRFAEVFSEGFDIGISSSREIGEEANELGAYQIDNFEKAIASSNYIFLAVPIHALDSVIEKINHHINPETWAFDMCSARVVAGKKMSSIKCRWFGIHAGFVIGEAPDEILEYLSGKGYNLPQITAEQHDERNSIVAMVHFIGMATDNLLSKNERQYLNKKSPASKNLLKLIDHLKANSPDTYWESQTQNQFTKHQRHRLLKAFREYSDKLDQGYFPFSERLFNTKSE